MSKCASNSSGWIGIQRRRTSRGNKCPPPGMPNDFVQATPVYAICLPEPGARSGRQKPLATSERRARDDCGGCEQRGHEKQGTKSKKPSGKAADVYRRIARRPGTRAEKIQAQSSQ